MAERTGAPEASGARQIAARVLRRVLKDSAFVAPTLDAELRSQPQLDARERSLATELVYGCVRTHTILLRELERLAPRGIAGGDLLVQSHLLVAAYQLRVLQRIPAFAAVDAGVSAIVALRGKKMGGFANAVLRKLSRTEPRLGRVEAIRGSIPPWLFDRVRQSVGEAEAYALFGAADEGGAFSRPDLTPIGIRLREGADCPEWLREAPLSPTVPGARRVAGIGDPRRLSGFDEGRFVVQEEGSQLVALALGARPGERVLDACAGRGQKTWLLAEGVGAQGTVCATDKSRKKLDALAAEFVRLELPAPRRSVIDWTHSVGDLSDDFDRVLVDAPCSGTGTLRRRPEISLRMTAADPARHAALALTLLNAAATRVRPGGRLVFSVCSVLGEECEAQIERAAPLLEPCPFDAPALEGLIETEATCLRLLPTVHGTDGFFLASFRRRE